MSKAFGLLAGVGVGLLFAQTCQVPPRDPHTRLTTPDAAGAHATAKTPAAVSPPGAAAPASPAAAAPETPAELFARTVRPILAERCAPCHNPGGKMYARLPFDDPKTVADHRGGIVQRIKGEERKTLEAWLAVMPPAPSSVHD
jgi:mono/diheme cytochrome c family protein